MQEFTMLKTKKMLSLILTMGMIFTLAACGVQKTNDSSPDNNTKTSDDGAIIDEVDGYDIADHELDFAVLKDIMSGAIKTTCQIMFIVCSATAFAYVLTRENVTANMAKALIGAANSTVMFWLLVTILLLIVGCIMDTVPAIMILAPLFAACLKTYGISDVAFGVIMVINLGIGLCTPPVGLNLYVAAGLRKVGIETVVNKHLWCYLGLAVLLLVIFMAFPQIITFLPSTAVK